MTAVIGLDLSFTACGVAVWNKPTGYPAKHGMTTIHVGANPTESKLVRIRRIVAAVVSIVDTLIPPVLAVVEGGYVTPGGTGDTALRLAGLRDVVEYALDARNVGVVEIAPSVVKKYATGNGSAGKQFMLRAATSKLAKAPRNHNEADALWLLAMGMHYGGSPLCSPLLVGCEPTVAGHWPHFVIPVHEREAPPT